MIRSGTSSRSPRFPSRKTPAPVDLNKITLNLKKWDNVIGKPLDKDEAYKRIEDILTFFIDLAILNDLGLTPAVQTLRESLSTLRRGGDLSREATKKYWRERIAQKLAANSYYDPVSTMRNLCLQGFPIFNIWDSISFIYTLCVEDIKS